MDTIVTYDSSSSDDDIHKPDPPPAELLKSSLIKSVDVAPVDEFLSIIPVDPHTRELVHNPTYEELFAPSVSYAEDPSVEGGAERRLVGETEKMSENDGKTICEKREKRKGDIRKRDSNWDPTSEDYTGPWAKYKDEVTVSVPSEEDRVYLEAYLAKKASKRRVVEEAPVEEKSTLHISTPFDYQVSILMLSLVI
ncbi:unnamed protein product [Trichobilharzia regenti]|nr:unnamed protein product [Trichobilharzia regenti]